MALEEKARTQNETLLLLDEGGGFVTANMTSHTPASCRLSLAACLLPITRHTNPKHSRLVQPKVSGCHPLPWRSRSGTPRLVVMRRSTGSSAGDGGAGGNGNSSFGSGSGPSSGSSNGKRTIGKIRKSISRRLSLSRRSSSSSTPREGEAASLLCVISPSSLQNLTPFTPSDVLSLDHLSNPNCCYR